MVLFKCDPQNLEDALCKRVMVTPKEVITRCLDPKAAMLRRDALAASSGIGNTNDSIHCNHGIMSAEDVCGCIGCKII
ncbi:unnamed protein product [Victoria cruziana]